MVKRFTDTMKWDDPWFRRLKSAEKMLWLYICDKADNAGMWKVDMELAEFYIGEKIDFDDVVKKINEGKERIKICNDGKNLFIVDFIEFQIGNLNSEKLTNLQKSAKKLIEKYIDTGKIDEDTYPYLTGKEPVPIGYKYKGKGKGINIKVLNNNNNNNNNNLNSNSNSNNIYNYNNSKNSTEELKIKKKELKIRFDKIWVEYPKRNNVRLGKKQAYEYFEKNFRDIDKSKKLYKAVINYKKLIERSDGYAKDFVRFLKHDTWREMLESENVEKSSKEKWNEYIK